MEKSKNFFQRLLAPYSKSQKRDFPFVYALVAFPVIQFAVFWVYVNASSIIMAFQDFSGGFTLNNFKNVYNAFVSVDTYGFNLLDSLGRSSLIWWIDLLVCFPVSLVTVYVLTCKIRFHYVYRVIYILPGLIGSIIWTAIMRLFMEQNGPVVTALEFIGVELPWAAKRHGLLGAAETAFPALLTLTTVTSLVGNSPVITGAYSRISDELMESADLDGAGFWTKLFSIAIPCIWSTITTLLIFRLCSIFTADCGVFLYSGGTGEPNMSTIGFQLFYMTKYISESGASDSAYGYPAALGLVLTMMTLPICLIGRHYLEKLNDVVS